MMYDVIVIGAGSGGLNIASFMNRVGFKVLMIDKSDEHIGGDCLNYGCVPSKALIHCAKMVHEGKEAERFGLKTSGKVDLKVVMDYVKSKQDVIREHENAEYFRKKGIDVELGPAKFAGKNEVEVNGKVFKGKRIVIATGSRPRRANIPGIENVNVVTNEEVFDVEKLPKHLLVMGGGPIGCELAQCFLRLGSKVTIVQRGPQFLPKEEPEVAQVLYDRLKQEGMEILFNSQIKEFKSGTKALIVDKNGHEMETDFDLVLMSIGRQINYEGLELEKAGIKMDESGRKIKVDSYLRTTNKNVYLCGDIVGSYQFTHAAELHAGVILNNFFSPRKKKLNNDHLSWVTFTAPEIATFGLNEKMLKERKIPYEKLSIDFADEDRAIVDEYTDGRLIMYIHKKSQKILGGSMVAPAAGELFQELVLANTNGMTIKQVFKKIYAYPTASRINKKLISTFMGKKLTHNTKRILKWLY